MAKVSNLFSPSLFFSSLFFPYLFFLLSKNSKYFGLDGKSRFSYQVLLFFFRVTDFCANGWKRGRSLINNIFSCVKQIKGEKNENGKVDFLYVEMNIISSRCVEKNSIFYDFLFVNSILKKGGFSSEFDFDRFFFA